MPSKSFTSPCADCQDAEGTLDIRRRQLCSDCFRRYVSSKVLKRMESYRLKVHKGEQRHSLLLPVSGGVSSLVLLHILDSQLRRQIDKQNKTAYDLTIVHLEALDTFENEQNSKWLQDLRNQFQLHAVIDSIPLDQMFVHDTDFENDIANLSIRRQPNESDDSLLYRALQSASSMTAKRDIEEIMLNRLIVAMAKKHNCESILWGHSDGRMAASALSNVAKGRGYAVPETTNDGPSSYGVSCNYPLRDLYKSELELYASLLPQQISNLITTRDVNPKTVLPFRETAIDDLLTNYILAQGGKYPSIMANVVRTAGKLQIPDTRTRPICPICRRSNSQDVEDSSLSNLCYGCERMKKDFRVL